MSNESLEFGNRSGKKEESKMQDRVWRTADGRPIDAQRNVIRTTIPSAENNANVYESMDTERIYGRIPGDQVEDAQLKSSYRANFESVLVQYAQRQAFPDNSSHGSGGEVLTLQSEEFVITENELNSEDIDVREEMASLINEAKELLKSESVKRGVILQERVKLLTFARLYGISEYSDESLVSDLETAKIQLSQAADEMKGKRDELVETKKLLDEATQRESDSVTSDNLKALRVKIERLERETEPLERLRKILDEYNSKIEFVVSLQDTNTK